MKLVALMECSEIRSNKCSLVNIFARLSQYTPVIVQYVDNEKGELEGLAGVRKGNNVV